MLVVSVAFALTVLDQVTKYAVRHVFHPGESVTLIPGVFSLTYVRNTGAAWGMLGGYNTWLALLSVVVLIVITVCRRTFLTQRLMHKLTLALLVAGIVGNLLDRVRLHYVVDFLDFYWGPHHFPAFNVADAAICVGVGLYVLSSFRFRADPSCRSLPRASDAD
jgi:signal peptidase II